MVGAPYEYHDDHNSGAAYVFRFDGSTWVEEQKLTADDGADFDSFGYSVAISGDTAVVGANFDDNDNGNNSGAAYVFVRSGTTWSQQAKLTASDGAADDYFGWSVAISGGTAVVGAHWDYHDDYNSGSAYVFVRSGTTWTQQAKLTATDGYQADYFGESVAISGDTAVVGAYCDDDKGDESGSAYVFVPGSTWNQQAKLTATDGYDLDQFGVSVAISGDTAVVGAHWDDDNGNSSGSAYVFVPGSTWNQQAKLTASDGAPTDWFGNSVAISGDIAVVGAHHDDDNGNDSGSAYVYQALPPSPSQPTPPGEAVGITVMPMDKAGLLLPWLGLAGLMVLGTGAAVFARRRIKR